MLMTWPASGGCIFKITRLSCLFSKAGLQLDIIISFKHEFNAMGISRQQLLILSILLFLSVLILGCLCMLAVPSPTTGGPAFVF